MGVPKFFRYISERYPCLSEVVREYQLPDFDNLYLDMNGIIHVCSHPNDTDPHFRITEEKIFRDIFHYIEMLFRMIQPQKLFFMAVDGVAPRAKMNQQRGRRFRSAKEAEVAEARARDRGEQLPSEDRFDSNCITPGTEFMTRLQAQLKYFVTFKVSTDKLWQKVKVILSGHECPGEGEHKIMDYIRYMKSQPDYNPNTRHCLYGLDADLIMLGLCTHEPHFSLLREEVKYGKKNNQKRIPTPEETTFFLLHLSLMREYLDLEFQQLKSTLPFPYDLECIIDDWVLMGFLVGNDFIPHLPDMHINKGALPLLYRTYIDVLPTLEGYINEGGTLRLDRFEAYMEKLAAFDMEQFKDVSADLHYIEGKTGGRKMAPGPGRERHSYKNKEDVLPPTSNKEESLAANKASLNNERPFEEPTVTKNKDLAALIASTDEMLEMSDDGDENYTDIDSDEDDDELTAYAEFCAHKKNYYMEKLEFDTVTPEVLRSQCEGYVRAIQWNLNYYYNGCCSWSWFYPHHYAPYISDIKNFSNLKLEYDLAVPFLPFQQLLAVLPSASKKLLPQAYHDLMVNDASPIIQFYPTEFKTDLNGKRQDWEAVVLIPFIEQVSLLKAMDSKENELADEEKSRNKHGPMQVYTYSHESLGSYTSPAHFPALANHHAREENVYREQLYVDPSRLVKGLCSGVRLHVYCLGFPTLRHIPFTAELRHAKVKVFESPSQGDNMLLTLLPRDKPRVRDVASQLLGRSVYVNWPHMFEARVVAVSGQRMRFQLNGDDTVTTEELSEKLEDQWDLSMNATKEKYFNRMGIQIGNTEIMVYACTLEDKKFMLVDGKCDVECVKQWSRFPIGYALQTTLADIEVHDPIHERTPTVEQLLPAGAIVFIIESVHYGSKGIVVETTNQRVKVAVDIYDQPKLDVFTNTKKGQSSFMPGHVLASKLGMSPHLLSRVTGTIFVKPAEGHESERKLNIGLNLKFNKRNEEVCGYTRRDKNNFWMYSSKTENELSQYMAKFPEVFNILTKNGADDILGADLFPSDTEENLARLSEFLKGLESGKTERQTCGAQVVDEVTVKEMESVIDEHAKRPGVCRELTMHLKPSSLYKPKPKLGQAPDAKAAYRLFDRVINARESHTVPLGAYGTIIGIHDADKGPQAMYDVLMDKEFLGGIKLRCSANRGYRLPAQAMINVTYGAACDASRRSGKPTAVVGPSGTIEDGHHQKKVHGVNDNMHNSAFASWCNTQIQEPEGSARHGGSSKRNQTNFNAATPFGNPHPHQQQSAPAPTRPLPPNNNPSSRNKTQQLSSEYLAMFQQLQKAGFNPNAKSHQSSKGPSHSLHDSSNALKKMLKIADNSSKRPLPTSSESIIAPRKNMHSYVMQLLSLHQSQGIKLPKYLYGENQEGMIVCTVMLSNGLEVQGTPAFTNDQAAESAASAVLTMLALEEPHLLTGPPKRGPPPFTHQPQHPNNRPQWRGSYQAANPSTLPQPPPKWYQATQGSQPVLPLPLQPDWRGGSSRFPSPSSSHFQHNHNISNAQAPFMQFPHNQMPWQNPFIPLQAEPRFRQPPPPQSQSHHQPHVQTKLQDRPFGNPRPARPHITRGGPSGRQSQPPEGTINTGRPHTAKPMRSRIAANFSKPFNFADTPPDSK